jgi:uncharacterized protein YbaR (Trm112 family)
MPINEQLLEILRCPATKAPLRPLTSDEVTALNARIENEEVTYQDGSAVDKPLEEGLVTEDGATVYRIDENIPVMLIEMGIPAG